MTGPSVLLLEAAGPDSQAVAVAARAAGIGVHAATHPGMAAAYPPGLREHLDAVVFTDFTDTDRAVRELTTHALRHRISGVLTLHEFLTPMAARLAAALGVPGNDPALAACARNKIAMVDRFAECGVPAPATRIVADVHDHAALLGTDDSDRGCAGGLGFPLVVKPAEHAGSTGVTVATTSQETAWGYRHAARCDRQAHYGLALDTRVLLQEHISGAEYSVESVTQDGATTHLAITRKQTTTGRARVETGHSLPADLPPIDAATVLEAASRAAAAVGIRDSFSHTEVILTPGGRAIVIETAARPGSGQITVLLQHALGLDPWKICLDVALGRPADLTPTRSGHYAAVRFLTSPAAGRLAAVHGLPAVGPGVPAVHLRCDIGDQVQASGSNSARLGHLIACGTDPAAVNARADRLLARVRISLHTDDHTDDIASADR